MPTGRPIRADDAIDRVAARRHTPGPKPGDVRRDALLEALEGLLAQRSFAEIDVADITRAAGVTRSAFYFYFSGKAAAVVALLSDLFEQMVHAAGDWNFRETGTPQERLTLAITETVRLWRTHAALIVAMLDAAGSDPEARRIWRAWQNRFAQQAANRIAQERTEGRACGSSDADTLAAVLVGAVASTMETDVRQNAAGETPSELITPALIEVWHRTIYNTH
jgi:AcrR family transcriptional regulator